MNGWMERLDAVTQRLRTLAEREPTGSLTDPHPGDTERWDVGQVWAHIAEFGDYWLDQLDLLMASQDDAPPFGRTKRDPGRIAAIAEGRDIPVSQHLDAALRALARTRAFMDGLDEDDWARTASHPTLGVLSMDEIMQEFLVGHYEQHADQLEHIT